MPKPKRESPVSAYIDHQLKKRATRVSQRPQGPSVSRIIEECLVMGLPEIERRVGIMSQAASSTVEGGAA